MSNKISHSVCTRCGKRRIFVSARTETVGSSKILISKAVCEDPSCQAMVDDALKKEADKRKQYKQKDQENNSKAKEKKKVTINVSA